jgi:hypothetical protein
VKIFVCSTNPAWEEWECRAQWRNLIDTVQKAALEALTTFCGKHPARRLCSQSNSCTWATHCTLCQIWSCPSNSGQLSW